MELTFLAAASGVPLAKRYAQDSVQSYPLVKNVNSRTVEIDKDNWLQSVANALSQAGTQGEALLKGSLTQPLQGQSRKGLTDNSKRNYLIVIDVDGLPVSSYDFEENHGRIQLNDILSMSEEVVSKLPDFLQDASYVAHASSSMGIKPGAHLHLFFVLDDPMLAKQHKAVLTLCNFHNKELTANTVLTASGLALKLPIDRTLGDNSRLIYIGNPLFVDGRADPVANRWLINSKGKDNEHGGKVHAKDVRRFLREYGTPDNYIKNRIRSLREKAGLQNKSPVNVTMPDGGDGQQQVAINPDRMTLTEVSADDTYVRFNVNNGDSAAYWVLRDDPRVVHNFKGEPPFLFSKADPKGFEHHCEKYGFDHEKIESVVQRMLFYDNEKDVVFGAEMCVDRGELVRPCIPVKRANYVHFIGSNDLPEVFPNCEYSFKPDDDRTVDMENGFINAYLPPAITKVAVALPDDAIGCTMARVHAVLPLICPMTYKLMFSVVGGEEGRQELVTFVNWFAYIVQNRQPTQVAWLFHGTEGTGKGVLLNRVLKPIIGAHHTKEIIQQAFEDSFNDWLEPTILLAMDEFRIHNKTDTRLFNKMKNLITEEELAVRPMRQSARMVKNYINLMLFSNDRDAVIVTANDRRFNVCPRQETPLFERFPEMREALAGPIDNEVPVFCQFLQHFVVDDEAARAPIHNKAKLEVQEATEGPTAPFAEAFKSGDIEYLLQVLELSTASLTDPEDFMAYNQVKEAVLAIPHGYTMRYTKQDLLRIYRLCGHQFKSSPTMFGKEMARYGLRTGEKPVRKLNHQHDADKKAFRGYEVKWKETDSTREYIALLQEDFSAERQGRGEE